MFIIKHFYPFSQHRTHLLLKLNTFTRLVEISQLTSNSKHFYPFSRNKSHLLLIVNTFTRFSRNKSTYF